MDDIKLSKSIRASLALLKLCNTCGKYSLCPHNGNDKYHCEAYKELENILKEIKED